MGARQWNIAVLAAGAGGMICGSCLRDNAMARALRRQGHAVTLVPLYTPLRVEGEAAGGGEVFYGGVNLYLQFASAVFRHTPRAVDWLLDRPGLLNWAGSKGAQRSPAELVEFTLSILRGEEGPTVKELRRLVRFLKEEVRPEVVTLPNLMFLGAARLLGQELGAAVVCELTGEDIFLEAATPADQERLRQVIRQQIGAVDRFVATSGYYAGKMAAYLGIERERIAVVYPGVPREMIGTGPGGDGSPTIGYMARICPEKGLDRLVEAVDQLRQRPGLEPVRLRAAGYLGPGHREWFESLAAQVAARGMDEHFQYLGEVSAEQKQQLLGSASVVCVPAAYPEAKGLYVLEALARGRPVVLPEHGAFGELIAQTGGGVLVPAGSVEALAGGLEELLRDRARQEELGRRGQQAVAARFTEDHMAEGMLKVFAQAREARP